MLFSAAQAAVPPSPARICSPDTNGKPPASPAGKEHMTQEDHCVFLIGAYQRCPALNPTQDSAPCVITRQIDWTFDITPLTHTSHNLPPHRLLLPPSTTRA